MFQAEEIIMRLPWSDKENGSSHRGENAVVPR